MNYSYQHHNPYSIRQDLLNRTIHGQETFWFKTLKEYYYRDQWELFDLENDPKETYNVASVPSYQTEFESLKKQLLKWQRATNDPWICSPDAVWENEGDYPPSGVCLPLDNGLGPEGLKPLLQGT